MTQEYQKDLTTGGSPFRKVGECLYRHESSAIYYALVKRSGKQYRRSLKTTDRKLAERKLADFRQKIGQLSQTASASGITVSGLASRWLGTLKSTLKPKSYCRRETSVGQIMPYLGSVTLRQITSRLCEDWASRRSPKIAASTYNNERGTLIAILDYGKREGLILDNPAKVLQRRKQPRTEIIIPTREEFSKLVRTLRTMDLRAQHAANLVELLAYSGMRLGEATSMRWRDVQFSTNKFLITGGEGGTKNHEVRTVPIFPALRNFLETLHDSEPRSPDDLIARISSAKKAIASACKKAELRQFTHHTMRHYFVSNAIELGIDFKVIAQWVGHKDGGLLVAKTYGHLRDTHSAEMAKRMTHSASDLP